MPQQTLVSNVTISGIGLHSGLPSNLLIKPAAINRGIVFKRVDLPGQPEIKALFSNVVDTRNCTCLGNIEGVRVSTVEHLMAALYICGIDNATVEVDNAELPIMDGSALPFYQALCEAGIAVQQAERQFLRILRPVEFSDDKGNRIEILPAGELVVRFVIDFPSKIVGRQEYNAPLTKANFEKLIAPCRTFCEKYQVDYLQAQGLIKGGSLENAVVLDGETVLNPDGFRVDKECVNHKVIDAIGDLYTSGYHLLGAVRAEKTGHYHNNELLKKIFSNPHNFSIE